MGQAGPDTILKATARSSMSIRCDFEVDHAVVVDTLMPLAERRREHEARLASTIRSGQPRSSDASNVAPFPVYSMP